MPVPVVILVIGLAGLGYAKDRLANAKSGKLQTPKTPKFISSCIPKGFGLKAQGCEPASYPGY